MSTQPQLKINGLGLLPLALFAWPVLSGAQVPVDDNGELIGDYSTVAPEPATGDEDIPLLSGTELEDLVGPIALYPDDLLAIVLPASAYPLQIVQAGRFLDALEDDPSLQPDESWDDSVVALVNYPEVVRLLNDDLDWTWRLGEAVVAQQADVIAAVETFRDRAYAAGNLKSDERQTVSRDEGYIEIMPVDDDVIYVPYYEPEHVVVHQPRPVYYYYPEPCPVYYYPYPSSYAFNRGFFWGVTTAYTVGWHSDRLRVFHHSYRGHPYYGRYYWPRWRYRQPTISVFNNVYVNNYSYRSRDYYRRGDYWRPSDRRTVRYGDRRVTRSRHYPGDDAIGNTRNREAASRSGRSRAQRNDIARRKDSRNDIEFRQRPKLAPGSTDRDRSADRDRSRQRHSPTRRKDPRKDVEFRQRPKLAAGSADLNRSADRNRAEKRRTSKRREDTRNDIKFRQRPKLAAGSADLKRSADRNRAEQRRTSKRRDATRAKEVSRPRQSRSSEKRYAERTSTRRAESRRPEQHRARSNGAEPRQKAAAKSERRQSKSRPAKSTVKTASVGKRKERARSNERRH